MSRSKITKQLVFSETMLKKAERKAENIGISFPDYVRHLIANDITDMVDSNLEKAIKEAREDYANGDYTVLSTKEDIENYVKALAKDELQD